jgi:nitrous oxidase accessory protein NosD
MITRFRGRLAGSVWTAVGFAAFLAISARWLGDWRLPSPDRAGGSVFRVTSGADAGPGSLREGIFAADRAGVRARIRIDVARITVQTPLPPLLNPAGIVIDGAAAGAVLDGTALAEGPVLDLMAPDCLIVGLRIQNARGEALLVRQRARIDRVTIANSQIGVYQTDGAGDLTIEGSTFERNTVGIQTGSSAWPITLRNNRFQNHRRAAIWAVRAEPPPSDGRAALQIVRNTFIGDRQSIVALNTPARIERNTFAEIQAAAVYASGSSVVIAANRIRSGRNFGVYLERAHHSLVADNELDHNCSGGVMARHSHDLRVTLNRVYANGYGIIVVEGSQVAPSILADNLIAQQAEDGIYVIGSSPMVRRNRLLQNRKAGLHLSSLTTTDGAFVLADPLLDGNVLSGNGADEVLRDHYAPPPREMGAEEPGDCAWRVNGGALQVARAGGDR